MPIEYKNLHPRFFLQYFSQSRQMNWTLADQMITSGSNFVTSILGVRILGGKEFGIYSIVFIGFLLMGSLQWAIISSPMMTFSQKLTRSEADDYFRVILWQQLIFSTALSLLVFLSMEEVHAFFPDAELGSLSLPFAIATFFLQMQEYSRRYYFSKGKSAFVLIQDVVRYLIQIGSLVLFWKFSIHIRTSGMLWVLSCASLLALVISFSGFPGLLGSWRNFYPIMVRQWHYSKWLIPTALMQWISDNAIILVTGSLLGAWSVGVLKAAQNIMGITNILLQAFDNIVPITASRLFHTEGSVGLVRYLKKTALLGGGAVIILSVIWASFAKFWLKLFYGNQFSEYGNIVSWYALISVIIFLALVVRSGLTALEKTKSWFISYAVMAVFNALIAYPVVHFWGLEGALWGLLLSLLLLTFLSLTYLRMQLRESSLSIPSLIGNP